MMAFDKTIIIIKKYINKITNNAYENKTFII